MKSKLQTKEKTEEYILDKSSELELFILKGHDKLETPLKVSVFEKTVKLCIEVDT